MKTNTNRALAAFAVGFVFALGLGISGMTQPQKVIGFLDVTAWDPSLIWVMVGAIAVHALAYAVVKHRPSPLLDTQWHVPTRKDITPQLLLGSVMFGVGWGMAGYCPGPALTSLASGQQNIFVFVIMMIVGMLLYLQSEKRK